MKFLSVKILGFKSFLEPMEIDLKNGLTGVVGPNGCGKSNVVEAIKWVMGENSAKQMRSSEMNSVIFSGTEERPSRNFAEVIIKIDNSQQKAPYPFTNFPELEISRKIERDKGSIYRVNDKIVRARDVQLIFADTGTGSRSSSIVSQGKISEIIDSKPEVRRIVIEEAANITGLHSRKHEAELKLNSATDNLDRLMDIENTLSEQLKELNKQARQVARYRSVGERIRKSESSLFYSQLKLLETELNIFKDKLKNKNNLISEFQIKVTNYENKKIKILDQIPNLKRIDNEKLNDLQNLKISKIKLEQEINSINETKKSLANQTNQLEDEIKRENEIIIDSDKTSKNLNNDLEKLKESGFNYFSRYKNAQSNTNKLRKTMEENNEKLSKINSKIHMISSNKGEIENEIIEINESISKIKKQLVFFKTDKDSKIINEGKKDKDRITKNLAKLKVSHDKNKHQLIIFNDSLEKLNINKIQLDNDINNLKTEISTIKSFLIDDEENSLERKLDLTENMEFPIAAILGEGLLAPIVKDNQSKKEHYWIEKFEPKKTINKLPDQIIPLTEQFKNIEILTNSLQGIGLAKSEKEAYSSQKELTFGQSITTLKGGLWRWDGYVQKPEAKNSFVKRLTLRKQLNSLEKELKKNNKLLEELNSNIKIETNKINEIKILLNKEENEISKYTIIIRDIDLNVSLSQSRVESSKLLIDELKSTELQGNKKLLALKEQVSSFKKLPSLLAEELKLRNSFENCKNEFETALSFEKQLNTQEEYRKMSLDQALIQIKNWDERKTNSASRLKNLDKKLQILILENKRLFSLPKVLSDKINIIDLNLGKSIEEQKKSSDNLIIKENELREIEKKQKSEEVNLVSLREEKVRIESEISNVNTNINNLEERINEKLGIELEELLENTGHKADDFKKIDTDFIEVLKLKVDRLLRERENIGAVNLRVEIEIEELNNKLDKMKVERDDLSKAIEKLKSGIYELNKEGRERLKNSFNQVNEKFKYLFNKLFHGGNAELQLTGSDDPLTSGLEIFACPPGKKMQNLSLLSGGEQALTSISLIFAVLLCNPSPLCILDEVDAALDDTNVSLFCSLLEELVEKEEMNFIIVTHHRLTMAKMNRLLGVTMQEKGISKLLAVDLEKAVEMREAS